MKKILGLFPDEELGSVTETFDLDGDNNPDGIVTYGDFNNDGVFDGVIITADTDRNGTADYESALLDFDGDGNPDYSSVAMSVDTDGDHIEDAVFFTEDIGNDGILETKELISAEEWAAFGSEGMESPSKTSALEMVMNNLTQMKQIRIRW